MLYKAIELHGIKPWSLDFLNTRLRTSLYMYRMEKKHSPTCKKGFHLMLEIMQHQPRQDM